MRYLCRSRRSLSGPRRHRFALRHARILTDPKKLAQLKAEAAEQHKLKLGHKDR